MTASNSSGVRLSSVFLRLPATWWACQDRFLLQVALNVHGQAFDGFVSASAVLFQALDDNPVQITVELRPQPERFDLAHPGGPGEFLVAQRFQFD
jgi:hypothetical protein